MLVAIAAIALRLGRLGFYVEQLLGFHPVALFFHVRDGDKDQVGQVGPDHELAPIHF
jgi:hypothetical protein